VAICCSHYNCSTIAFADIGQCHEQTDLTTAEFAVVISELRAHSPFMASTMQWRCPSTRAAAVRSLHDNGEIFVKIQPTAYWRPSGRTTVAMHVVDPSGMINELLPDGAGLEQIVQVPHPRHGVRGAIVHPASPLAYYQYRQQMANAQQRPIYHFLLGVLAIPGCKSK
jgi:hypothetical protein